MSRECLVSGRCLEVYGIRKKGTSKVSGKCPEGVQKVSGVCLEGMSGIAVVSKLSLSQSQS